ncbi:DUF4232 domain-containing protein [Streptomyces sp. SID486]|uniref:DUF4232 domain-containing protein n=1 Tax=Streptomyces sp. SID486 TaxID=2690264 RepID=UPI00136BE411|nr:DUF4232 domain-containing protein [Streptomyces sp. SID486]MYX98402.1 DUF4232 domain-containing protein [Streptomyces sp. SID486]
MARRILAVAALGLVVTLGSAACGTDRSASDARSVACRTSQLDWKMTRLLGKHPDGGAATLSAENNGPKSCAFDGYPDIDVHIGKGPAADGKPKRGAAPVHVELHPGHTVEFPLFYEATAAPGDGCEVSAAYDPSITVVPPHTKDGSSVRMTDAKGRHVRAQVCDFDIEVGAPQLR